MKVYFTALGAGALVGAIYSLLGVRSPAPPIVALVGLLGMLLGEQAVPVARRIMSRAPLTASWFASACAPKITGITNPQPTPHETINERPKRP
jgi:XapX domain-containing protein